MAAAGASRPFLKLGISKGFEYATTRPRPPDRGSPDDARRCADRSRRDVPGRRRTRSSPPGATTSPRIGQGTNKRDTGQVDLESMVAYMAEIERPRPTTPSARSASTLPAPAGRAGLRGRLCLMSHFPPSTSAPPSRECRPSRSASAWCRLAGSGVRSVRRFPPLMPTEAARPPSPSRCRKASPATRRSELRSRCRSP